MKILVCFEGRVRPDSTGFYFLNAFKTLGHDVTHVHPDELHTVKPGQYDLYFKCDDGIRSEWNKDLHPSIYQVIDTHIESDWRIELAEKGEFDLVCVAQKEGLNLDWKNKKVIWLPLAADPQKHYVGHRDKKYDVAVIMNFHSQYAPGRIDYVHTILGAVPEFFFGSRTYEEMAEKFAESRIVFNHALNGDINMRFFEGMMSGSCLLTDRLEAMKDLGFVEGKHYIGYESKEDLVATAQAILKDSEKLEYVAKNGREEVLSGHTYRHRAERMLQEIK